MNAAARNLKEALHFAGRGIPVFPLKLAWNAHEKKFDKTPLVKWRDEAAADEATIRRWGQDGQTGTWCIV
jgi:hypothetical protein